MRYERFVLVTIHTCLFIFLMQGKAEVKVTFCPPSKPSEKPAVPITRSIVCTTYQVLVIIVRYFLLMGLF